MRYTDLTNEELDAILEMAQRLINKDISKLSFDLFMFGLNQKVKNRKKHRII